MTLESGTTIGGGYQIIQPLGSGAFGQTYLAEDRQQPGKHQCVVKQLKPRETTSSVLQDAEQRFEREATALYQLGNHPQIPRLLAHFAEDREFYLVQEFIDGQDLEKEFKQRPWSETEVIALLQDVLEILEFVHQQRAIHRDIKPPNLILRQDGRIVLIDFGSVKEISSLSANKQGQTVVTKVVGTLVYMPPEQQNGKPVFSSDIYALGMTAIEASLGCRLVELETDLQTGETIWRDRLQVSKKLFAILDKMVRRNYRERYQGASEVLQDLEPLTGMGKTIGGGRYKILSYLGGGIFGHTYKAENILQPYKSPCIVKQLQPRSSDPEILTQAQSRFGTEVAVLRKLGHHRQIPELLDDFQEQQDFYLVQEFIAGEDLSKEIAGGKSWSEAKVVALLQDVLKTLDFIHKERVIHCDIKPSNLIRRQPDGKIVLIDFGAVKEIVNSTLNSPEPRTSKPPLGTEGYMAPEQTVGRPTFSSDFYALGMTAIQALTGIPPQQLPADPQTGEIVWRENASVSPGLARILDKMVYYDFRQRYKSAAEILKLLQKFPSSKSASNSSFTSKTKRPAGAGIKPWYFLAALPFVLLAITGVMFVAGKFQRIFAVQEAIALYGEAIEAIEAPASDPTEKQKTNEKALELLNKALKLHPDFPQALASKGYVLGQLKRPLREKYSACNRAIEIWPDFAGAYNCRGEAQKEDGDYPAAIKDYERAIELDDPENPNRPDYNDGTTTRRQAWYNKGEVFLKLNKCPEAISAYQEASNLDFEPAKKKLEQVQCKEEDNN